MAKSATATKGYEPQRLNTFNAKSKVHAKKGHSADLQGTLPTVNGVPQYGRPRNSALATAGRLQGRKGPQDEKHNTDCGCDTCTVKKAGGAEGPDQAELLLASASQGEDGVYRPDNIICPDVEYDALRRAVDEAKDAAGSLRGCSKKALKGVEVTCELIAAKVLAQAGELLARAALEAACFETIDDRHQRQINEKSAAMDKCKELFDSLNCPDDLKQAVRRAVDQVENALNVATEGGGGLAALAAIVTAIAAIIALIYFFPVVAAVAGLAAVLAMLTRLGSALAQA